MPWFGRRRCADMLLVALVTVAINGALLALQRRPDTTVPPPPPPSPSMSPSLAASRAPTRSGTRSVSPSPSLTPLPTVPVVRRIVHSRQAPPPPPSRALPVPWSAGGRPFYLVASPESNGNRFVVKLLLSAGCFGVSGHQQPFDVARQVAWPNQFRATAFTQPCGVMHRSVPHATVWPDLVGLVRKIKSAGFEPRLLVSLRPEDAARASQVAQKHVKTSAQAEHNILRAQRHIMTAVAALPDLWVRFVLYEQLGHEHYLNWLFGEQMALTLPADHPQFEDRDIPAPAFLFPEALDVATYLEIMPMPHMLDMPTSSDQRRGPEPVEGPMTAQQTWSIHDRERRMLRRTVECDHRTLQATFRATASARAGKHRANGSLSDHETRIIHASVQRFCRSHMSHRMAVWRQLRTYWSVIEALKSRSPLICTEDLESRLTWMINTEGLALDVVAFPSLDMPTVVEVPNSPCGSPIQKKM